ncbi:MAG: hypothetical protein ACTSVB_08045 [Candidatus Heimdallarchaeaceae archaeon]
MIEKFIIDILKKHQGHHAAIKRKDLLKSIKIHYEDITDRELRCIVERLVKNYGYPIGTSTAGYFWISTIDDLDEAIESLRKKAISLLIRSRQLRNNWFDFHQLKFPFFETINRRVYENN